jgi:hypothetical protein
MGAWKTQGTGPLTPSRAREQSHNGRERDGVALPHPAALSSTSQYQLPQHDRNPTAQDGFWGKE